MLATDKQIKYLCALADKVEKIKGMNIVFTTTAKTDEEALELLKLLGMPFEK